MNKLSQISITENCYIVIDKTFIDFDVDKLELDILENKGFKIDIMYSINFNNPHREWSLSKSVDEFINEIKQQKEYHRINGLKFKVRLKFKVLKLDETISFKSYDINNPFFSTSEVQYRLDINDLKYNNESIIDSVKTEEYIDVINKFPLFNINNNQQISVNRWQEECVAITNRLGMQAIYFKTSFDSTSQTLNSVKSRDVVSCKKIMFIAPDSELPSDRTTFSEWEIPMNDEFIIHIPDLLFKIIFGNTVPETKDYLYIPITNKIYSINSVQVGIKFMNQIGWWECYLVKYEDDKSINKSKALSSINEVINTIPNIDSKDISEIYEHFESTLTDGLQDSDTILTNTIEEKKEATDNFSNTVIDSVNFISLKETENQREFYNKRLEIVTLNQANNTFPTNFYNFQTIPINVLGLNYDLIDATKINKHSRIISNDTQFDVVFNFILVKRFNGTVLDLIYNKSNIFFSIQMVGKSLKIKYNDTDEYIVNYKFTENNFYQITIDSTDIMIYELVNNRKELVHQLTYDYRWKLNQPNIELEKINLFGGNYLLGEFKLLIDNKIIIADKTKPILKMNNFGTI